ncbi:unnamed protein product [Rotaria sp. Silwood1]|nr:unnamed protein product [Rotaria sp. Silwood1]
MRKTSGVNIDLLSFVRPFSRNLWLLVLATCIHAGGLLLCLIERKDNETLQNRSILSQVAMSTCYSFGHIVEYTVEFHVITYTAHLTSDLTLLKSKNIISRNNDIKSGKISFYRIGIRSGSESEHYCLREISDGNKNYYPLKSQQELYDSLLDGTIDASFMDTGMAEYITNNIYCNLTLIGQHFDKGVFGIVTPNEWLYAKVLIVNFYY